MHSLYVLLNGRGVMQGLEGVSYILARLIVRTGL